MTHRHSCFVRDYQKEKKLCHLIDYRVEEDELHQPKEFDLKSDNRLGGLTAVTTDRNGSNDFVLRLLIKKTLHPNISCIIFCSENDLLQLVLTLTWMSKFCSLCRSYYFEGHTLTAHSD